MIIAWKIQCFYFNKGCGIIPGRKMEPRYQARPEFSAMREALEEGDASCIVLNSGRAWSLGSIFPPGIIQQPSCLDIETNSTWKKSIEQFLFFKICQFIGSRPHYQYISQFSQF